MEISAKLWYLEQFDLLNVLSIDQRLSMAENIVSKHYKKGTPISFDLNSENRIYMLKTGSVKIGQYTEDSNEILRCVLKRGNIFGEMNIINEYGDDFAIALNDCIICSMQMEDLKASMRQNQRFSTSIYQLIGKRLRRIENKLENIMFKDAKTRIFDFLEEFAQDFGQKKNDILIVNNPLTNSDIASLTFTSRQTVSSVFNDLKREGIIDYNNQQIKFLNK